MKKQDIKTGQRVRHRKTGEQSWSASYTARGKTASGLILSAALDSKHVWVVPFAGHEFEVTSE